MKSPKQPTEPADTPEVRELFANISDLYSVAKGFSGTVVRSVGTKYATETRFFAGSGAGFEGILVPSARNTKGKNIVVFPKNLSKSSKLRMIAADELK